MMNTNDTQTVIIAKVKELLDVDVKDIQIPPQGMDSDVFFITDGNGKEYAIKHSTGASTDILAYDLLRANNIKIPVPKMFGSFTINDKPVVILEKIKFPLLETVSVSQMYKYIPSMVENLEEIHKVKSNNTGYLSSQSEILTWKDRVLSKFSGSDPSVNWNEISKRKGLDERLTLSSVDKILNTISHTDFIDGSYSFLHTDFNQRNLFINPDSNNITGIIDWGEAMFGDPIFDFARVRMYIWHFNLGDEVIKNYYQLLSYTPEEKRLDDLYWLSRVIEYLAYYSEELNEFNVGRIKLHQDFLTSYDWE